MSNALGLVVDALPGLVWSTDPAGGLDFINQRWHDYTGLDLAQARGQGWQLAIHPEDLPHMLSIWGGIIASGDAGELEARLRRSDGVYRWFLFRACPVLDASGAMIKWCGINTDIEERKRMEQALRASERELYQLIDSVPGMVAVADAAGELEYASKRTLDYADSTFEQLSSRALLDAIHPEERESVTQEWLRCRDVGEAMELDHRLRRFDGVYRWFHVRAEPFRDEHGRIVRWYGLRTDIDDQRRAEEALSVARAELAHVARITSLGALTASIAHEVNQPLSGIITNAGTCLRMLGVDPPNVEGARETARRTIRDGNRAAAVIDRLRAMFSKKKLMKESVDLNEAAREVIALSLSELQRGGVIVRAELDDDLPPITGDRVQLQQVILNLVLNASDAMSTVEDRPRQLVVRTEEDGSGGARLTVEDAGIGIEPQFMDRLFDAFYTTKNSGMGIGLSVSKSIIESHDGRLWAASNNGPGSAFAFSIPRILQQATASR